MSEPTPRKTKPKKIKTSHTHLGQWAWWKALVLRVCLVLAIVGALTAVIMVSYYSHLAKAYDLAKLGLMPERSIVYETPISAQESPVATSQPLQ